MSAIITFIPSLVIPSLFQIVLSGSQVVLLPIIEVISSVIYMALTAMGCGGVGVGGGALGACGCGGIVGLIMSYVTMFMTALGGMFGLGGGGVIGGIGGLIGGGAVCGIIVDMVNFVVNIMMALYNSLFGFISGLI
ncbi:MAG: hypothetical protein MASP_00524 [Candidatus Methanolliviera sp. GoM_asphalt]|nr:MAG: hypothetical protein MASP_00524 [Candidatus Methanolliviera sp. GoM_asphalt]